MGADDFDLANADPYARSIQASAKAKQEGTRKGAAANQRQLSAAEKKEQQKRRAVQDAFNRAEMEQQRIALNKNYGWELYDKAARDKDERTPASLEMGINGPAELQEGRYTNAGRSYDIVVEKKEDGSYSFGIASSSGSTSDHIVELVDAMKFARAKGISYFTLSFPDIDWQKNKVSLTRATKQLDKMLNEAQKLGVIIDPNSSGLRAVINAITPKEKSQRYQQRLDSLPHNSKRIDLIRGQGTTGYFEKSVEQLQKSREKIGKEDFAGMSSDDKLKVIDKRMAKLEKAKDVLDRGVKKVNDLYSRDDEAMLEDLKNPFAKAGKDYSEQLSRIKQHVADVHLPKIEKLREAVKEEADAIKELQSALDKELDIVREDKSEKSSEAEAVADVDATPAAAEGDAKDEVDIPENFFEDDGGVPEPEKVEEVAAKPDLGLEMLKVEEELQLAKKQAEDAQGKVGEKEQELDDLLKQHNEAVKEADPVKVGKLKTQIDNAKAGMKDVRAEAGKQQEQVKELEGKYKELATQSQANRVVDRPDVVREGAKQTQEKKPEKKTDVEPSQSPSKATPEQQQKLDKVHKQLEAMKKALKQAKEQEEKLKAKYQGQEPEKKQGARPGGP